MAERLRIRQTDWILRCFVKNAAPSLGRLK